MEKEDFIRLRNYLSATQDQIARLLSLSSQAIKSYEQGWRRIPPYVERQMLFLVYLKNNKVMAVPCWDKKNCSNEWRNNCAAWKLNAGGLCWFINGTYCEGNYSKNWADKMILCRQCEIFLQTTNIE